MEFNGIKVDVREAGRRLRVLNAELSTVSAELAGYIPDGLPFEFNWGSRTQTSCIIFGGSVKYKERGNYLDPETGLLARAKATAEWPLFSGEAIDPSLCEGQTDKGRWIYQGNVQDTYGSGVKKGAAKFKKVSIEGPLKEKWLEKLWAFPGYTEPNQGWQTKTTDGLGNPLYATGAEVIEELQLRDIPFLKALGRKQALDKEIGTYYVRYDEKKKMHVGMLTCVQRHDHILHHNLNHVLTVTTRLSSSNPNLQNIPRGDKSEVKAMFISRFGEEGVVIEADYSQLEVVVQGVLSKDAQLTADLIARIDFHCKRVSAKYGCTYEEALYWCKSEEFVDYKLWKSRRTGVKEFSFQRAYGAGAAAIAAATGIPLEDVKQLIEQEDQLYPGITKFNADVEAKVYGSAEPFNARNDFGEWHMYRKGYYVVPTGTRYGFRTYDAPAFLQKRGIKDSFSPPELKNYPVQGTGGEFVQAVLGLLWRHFVANDNYGGRAFLINTVHDCVWIDAHKSVLKEVAADVKRIMESIPEFYNSRYGMGIVVPFPVEVEAGPNMHNLKHIS